METEGRYSDHAESHSVPGIEESVSIQPQNRGKLESKKKLKKMRSIRLVRLSSMRSSTREGKAQHGNLSILSSVGTESLKAVTPPEMADASPNYMKATTSSSRSKDSFQNTHRLFTKKTLTRMSTWKLKRSLTRKLSGRTEPKRKLKSSTSTKLATFKAPKSTRNLSESIHGSDGQSCRSANDAGNKPQRVITRRLSFKPVRILTKMPTFKSKNSSKEKECNISPSQDSSVHRATCSSTLKDSHFPDHIYLPQDESASQGVPAVKVCPYSYCSLHGHRHGNLPPLKRFVSMRRRMLKTQKSMKMDGQPVTRSKKSINAKKATKKTQTVHSESFRSHFQYMKKQAKDSCIRPHDTPASTVAEGETSGKEHEEKHKFRSNAEALLGETSYPHMINFEEFHTDSSAVKGRTSMDSKETSMEFCSIATEEDKSETLGSDNNINMAACKKKDGSANVESTSTDLVMFSSSDSEILVGEVPTLDKNVEPDCEVPQESSVQKEATPASTTDVARGVQDSDKKYVKMWQLMYKHAVLSNTGKCENKLNKEGREQYSLAINEIKSDDCEKDQDTDDENKNVIELLQKAFDEILLPEPEDLVSDDHSKSDEEHLESNAGKRERNMSASTESPKEAQKMETKYDQRAPKSWSNLKKLILLKRFVKALEKVRKLNPRRSRSLPSDANSEMEKVHLKHQTSEEKKNAEEWMLDYALQKVISKLAPAQRQKVTLLAEAFESILPFQDAENSPQSFARMDALANPFRCLDNSSNHGKEEASFSPNRTMEVADNVGDGPTKELHNPIMLRERCLDYTGTETIKNMPASGAIEEDLSGKQSLACSYDNEKKLSTENECIYLEEVKDSRSSTLNKPVEITSKFHDEAPTNETVNEVPEDLICRADTENPVIKSESSGRDAEAMNPVGDNGEQFSKSKNLLLEGLVRSLRSNLVVSGAPANQDTEEKNENSKSETETLEKFPRQELSEAHMSAVVEPETPVEKQSHAGLWYLVYKHMLSNMAENKSQSPIDEVDEKEPRYDGIISYESTSVTNQDVQFKDRVVADPEVEQQQIEAIKMVEEAIDSILPDDQNDLPDKKSLTDNTILDSSKQSNRTERAYSEGLNQKEEKMESGSGIVHEQLEESAPKEGNKTNQQLPRSWSNLKKVILLRRFIKSLEKVRKFNPRGPRYLPVEPGSEDEKVLLRHQDIAERKGTEEWMLDYALRQVVSKLTPARKRKVELLVEAFETVTPSIQN